jgi:glycosyltransferase involved in cell wall biosynthesis
VATPGEPAITIPANTPNMPAYKHLEIIRHTKNITSHLWWQMITLQWFLLTHKEYIVLEFGNTCLPFAPGIVFLHDIYCELYPEDFTSFRDKVIRLYNKYQYRLIARKAKKIITVSYFSRNQIAGHFNIVPESIAVIYNGWEHFRSVKPDYSIFDRYPDLLEKKYFFTLGSLSKRKNLEWILQYAWKNPDSLFAVSGTSLPTVKINEKSFSLRDNVKLLGYIDDGKVKALMEKCRAFVMPSYYEGFGIPPLEAISCGTPVVISNSASLPEIYGNTAHYIDPDNTDIDIERLLAEPVEDPAAVLKKYSYKSAAEDIYKIIKEFSEKA